MRWRGRQRAAEDVCGRIDSMTAILRADAREPRRRGGCGGWHGSRRDGMRASRRSDATAVREAGSDPEGP